MNTSRNLHKWRSNAARYPGLFRVFDRIPREWIAGFLVLAGVLVGSTAALGQGATPPGPLDQWTKAYSGTTHQLNAVAVNHHIVVAIGNSGTIVTSTNGVDWVPQTSGVTNNLNAIVYANGLFVAGGDAGTILTSTDGSTWTRQPSNTTDAIYRFAFGNGVFVAVGDNRLNLTSPDGIHWTYHQFPDDGTFYQDYVLAFGNGRFVAIKSDGFLSILSSVDGVDWLSRDTPPFGPWWEFGGGVSSLNYDNGYFYFLGGNGDLDANFILISDDTEFWWGGYFENSWYFDGQVGIGNHQALVIFTGSGLRTADIQRLNADHPLWVDPVNSPDFYAIDYFTFRRQFSIQLLGIGFWHSRFVAVGDSGAIYLSGTLPAYLSAISQSGNTTTVSMEGLPLESYLLQSAAAPSGPWLPVSTNSTTADGTVTFTDPTPPGGGNRFYRVTGP